MRSTQYNGTTFSYHQRSAHGAPVKLACTIPWRRDLLGTPESGTDPLAQEALQKYAQSFAESLSGFQGSDWRLVSANRGATTTGAPAVLVEVAHQS